MRKEKRTSMNREIADHEETKNTRRTWSQRNGRNGLWSLVRFSFSFFFSLSLFPFLPLPRPIDIGQVVIDAVCNAPARISLREKEIAFVAASPTFSDVYAEL